MTAPFPPEAAGLCDAAAALYLRRPDPGLLEAAGRLFPRAEGEATLEAALDDWRDLFFAPGSGRYLPPLASAVLTGRLGGAIAAEAADAYALAGFSPGRLAVDALWRPRLAPDHIGLELAFLAALLQSAAARPKEAQGLHASARLFHRLHLAALAEGYGARLAEAARSACFKGLGRLTAALGQL